jgi:hypothetical protein
MEARPPEDETKLYTADLKNDAEKKGTNMFLNADKQNYRRIFNITYPKFRIFLIHTHVCFQYNEER